MFICIAGILFALFSPLGALRLAVLLHGYPIDAVLLSASISQKGTSVNAGFYTEPSDLLHNAHVYTITEHIPLEHATGIRLQNWIVFKYGIFYYAQYYGYG